MGILSSYQEKQAMYKIELTTFEAREPVSDQMHSAKDFYHEMGDFCNIGQEAFAVITLNQKNMIIDTHVIGLGSVSKVLVHPREVFRTAIIDGASSIVLVHNHPSGDCKPSLDDKKITERMNSVGELVGIKLLDHIIVSHKGYLSFVDEGIL
jgi:DNA repair protein RadC